MQWYTHFPFSSHIQEKLDKFSTIPYSVGSERFKYFQAFLFGIITLSLVKAYAWKKFRMHQIKQKKKYIVVETTSRSR